MKNDLRKRRTFRKSWVDPHVGVCLLCALSGLAQVPVPINELVFKGTHNSYACRDNCVIYPDIGCEQTPPVMHHSVSQQIDDFGVWAIELDYSILITNNEPRAVVGHDGPASVNCPGYYFLTDYFADILASASLNYRPIFIYFENKHANFGDPSFAQPSAYFPVVERELTNAFSPERVFGPARLAAFTNAHGGAYPSVVDLAGKIIPSTLDMICGTDVIFGDERVSGCVDNLGMQSQERDDCIGPSEVQDYVTQNKKILRFDQYQEDWTFRYVVPPNPLVVNAGASNLTTLAAQETAQPCDSEAVHEQGTVRFPFIRVTNAVERARGITTAGTALARSGYGWTVLIKSGNYPEATKINIPLTLKAYGGAVVIGR